MDVTMKLSLTYSAYREMEQIVGTPLRDIGEAILALAYDPAPAGRTNLSGQLGCYCLPIDGYFILYHVGRPEDGVTVLGVLADSNPSIH